MRHKATAEADLRHTSDNVEPFAGPVRSVGDRLRNAREDLGLELRQVSDTLRIRYAHLHALENGNLSELPGQTYAVGFVRTYADYLGLDSVEMVERYKEEMSGIPRSTQLVFPTPKPEGKIPGGALVVISLLLVGLAYGGWYAFNEYGDELNSLIMREAPPDSVAEADGGTSGSAADAPAQEPASAPPAAAPSGAAEAPASPEPAASEPAASEPAPATSAETVDGGSAVGQPAEPQVAAPAPATPAPATQAPAAQAPAEAPGSGAADATADSLAAADSPPPAETGEGVVPAQPAELATSRQQPAPAAEAAPETVPEAAAETASGPQAADQDAREVAAPSEALPSVAPGASPPPAPARGSLAEAPADETVSDVGPQPAAEPSPQAASEPAPQTTVAREESIPVPPIPQAGEGGQSARAARSFGTANTDARIVLRATADSWVQVRNARSDLLFTQVLRAGDSYRVPNEAGLTLLTGNAGGLQVLVDGQAAPSLGPNGAVRRDIPLDPQRLSQGAQ